MLYCIIIYGRAKGNQQCRENVENEMTFSIYLYKVNVAKIIVIFESGK